MIYPETQDECWKWRGTPEHYQEQAAIAAIEAGVTIMPWCWIEAGCGTELCMEPRHLLVHAPERLEYPNRICIYCGRGGFTRDHLMPVRVTGDAARKHVLTVPACGECNSIISDKPVSSITGRRAIAKAGLRKKYKRILRAHEYSDEEIEEFGPGLRPTILRARAEKADVQERLDFAKDHAYDLRYLGPLWN